MQIVTKRELRMEIGKAILLTDKTDFKPKKIISKRYNNYKHNM